MHAALAEVPVQGRVVVAELAEQVLQVTQVVAEPLGRYGGVLPALPGLPVVRRAGGHAESGLAGLEHLLLAFGVVGEGDVRLLLATADGPQQRVRLCVDVLLAVAAVQHHQPAVALGQVVEGVQVGAFFAHQLGHAPVQGLQLAGRAVLQQPGDVVGGGADVVVAEDEQRLVRRHGHEVEFGAQDGHQGALAADERLGDVEAVLGQQGVEVVAGDAAGDLGVAAADVGEVLGGDVVEAGVDLREPATAGDDAGALVGRGGADPGALSVVGEDLQAPDVVDGLAVGLGGGAAGVVADHAAERAVAVGGGFGAELELVAGEVPVEFVQDDAGLHHAGAPLRVDGEHTGAVLAPVDHHGGVGGLSGQARAAAPGEDGGVEACAHRHRPGARLDGPGHDDAQWDLPVVRTVRGVGAAAARVEADFAVHLGAQGRLQAGPVRRGHLRSSIRSVGAPTYCACPAVRDPASTPANRQSKLNSSNWTAWTVGPSLGGMADISDSATRAARDLRVVFSRLRRRIREVAQDADLSPSQESALTLVGKHGAATASALAAAEGVRPQSMATTLAALEQHGLIRRAPDPDDGRRQLVTLTDGGRARVEGNRQAREEWLARAFQDRYTEEERQTVLAALELMERLSRP